MARVLNLFPPNYRKINDKFRVRGKPIIFAYGSTIYNPGRITIPPQLIAHEEVHMVRQGGNPEAWWDRYINDPEFRLAEEIPAHVAEYRALAYRYDADKQLDRIAQRLASPLYGSMIPQDKARKVILDAAMEGSPATTGE
jgi:hypothetical protein